MARTKTIYGDRVVLVGATIKFRNFVKTAKFMDEKGKNAYSLTVRIEKDSESYTDAVASIAKVCKEYDIEEPHTFLKDVEADDYTTKEEASNLAEIKFDLYKDALKDVTFFNSLGEQVNFEKCSTEDDHIFYYGVRIHVISQIKVTSFHQDKYIKLQLQGVKFFDKPRKKAKTLVTNDDFKGLPEKKTKLPF